MATMKKFQVIDPNFHSNDGVKYRVGEHVDLEVEKGKRLQKLGVVAPVITEPSAEEVAKVDSSKVKEPKSGNQSK